MIVRHLRIKMHQLMRFHFRIARYDADILSGNRKENGKENSKEKVKIYSERN